MPRPEHADVIITSRERVVFPDAGYTKGELADYYAALAERMLPWMTRRPVSLVRCPQGRQGKCFFQKHDTGGFGPHVRTVPIEEKDGEIADYLYVADMSGILACVQMGTIEFHGWGSLADQVEAPDRMVFDLDPDEGLGFGEVKQAAKEVKRRLAERGLASFAMLTGGKGIHVIVPLMPGHSWDAHRDFAKALAGAMAKAAPDRFTATMSKAKRKGKIFIDWLRNARGSTAIMPYSVRARTGAPVAVPIAWSQLDKAPNAHPYSIGDAGLLRRRARSAGLAGWGLCDQRLPES